SRSKTLCYNLSFTTMKPVLAKVIPLRPSILALGIALATVMIVGCGGAPPSTPATMTSGIKKRVLLSNQQSGSVLIVDATKDTLTNSGFTVFGATRMATNGGTSAVISSSGSNVGLFDDVKEQAGVQPVFPNQ